MISALKEFAGVLVKDTGRYLPALNGRGVTENGDPRWVHLCNRNERLIPNPDGPGVQCDWKWTSDLHACGVMPRWGRQLVKRAFADWPIEFAEPPVSQAGPKFSFVFAHGGKERLPLLQMVLRSVFGQVDVSVECIVVDQSPRPSRDHLPQGVKYRHLDVAHLSPGWRKSWAYNVGARMASGDVLVFHDGDILMPASYAAELVRHLVEGNCEAASIQRLLFYMSEQTTAQMLKDGGIVTSTPATILQNWTGGTIAIRRESFFEIGGFDEGYVDWGGEDDEFYERCGLLRHCRFGYLPFLHLWHGKQPGRFASWNRTLTDVHPARMAVDRRDRVQELSVRSWGMAQSPDPPDGYVTALVAESSSGGIH